MSELDIQIEEGRTAFEPGETIGVNLEWSLSSAPSELQLRAVWNTVGKGTTDMGTEQSITIDGPGAAESRRIEFKLPAAPYSFSGSLVSLVWALELVAGHSNSFRKGIAIGPGASEVLLNREGEGGG